MHSALRNFAMTLLAVLAILFALTTPQHRGDAVEYTLATVALAKHGTPDIRASDVATARQFAPGLGEVYERLEQDMRTGSDRLYAAFMRGKDGDVYAVHFFGYSALAALPYKLLWRIGMDPLNASS